jgi:serine/threonine protein phosphatase PrpC
MTSGHCPRCAEPVAPQDRYCEQCGARVKAQQRDRVEINIGMAAGVSDRGLHHYRNEDALELRSLDGSGGHGVTLAVVCDGVSTAARPDDASETAAEVAAEALMVALRADESPETAMEEAIRVADVAVAGLAGSSRAERSAPACTLVSAVVAGNAVTVGWVGDSRAYWIPRSSTAQAPPIRLTEDDSWLAHVLAAGAVSPARAAADRRSHTITAWLGKDAIEFAPHLRTIKPEGPGVVVICTDGLWNYLEDVHDLAAALPADAYDAPLNAAQRLVDVALRAGGRDNITVAVLPFATQLGGL